MRNNNLWAISLKTMMMSAFASIISFMLNCLIVIMASNAFSVNGDAVAVRIFMQFVGLGVQLIFIYGVIWECANQDQHLVRVGEKHYSKYRGFLIGLIAAIPYYLMAIAMMLMSFDVIPDITGLLRACSSQFWGIYTFLLPVETTYIEQGTSGHIAESIATPAQAIAAVFVPTIIPLLAQFPYAMGRSGFSFGEKLVLKGNKK